MQSGLVSVIIPSYNYGVYLEECVRSVLAQTYSAWEMIIADDGSTDDTPAIVERLRSLAPDRIQYLRLQNRGVAEARNCAIERTTGEFIMPLDADDMLEPTALEEFVAALRADAHAGYAYSNLENYGALPGDLSQWWQGPFFRGRITHENSAASASMWRRALWQQGVRYRHAIFEDWDVWLQIVALGYRGAYVPKVLFKYRMHITGRTSRNKYLYLPALLQVMQLNPSLYDPALVRWASRALASSPGCWNRPTVVLLPAPESAEFQELGGVLAELAHEFLERKHFVVVIGNYDVQKETPPGMLLLGVGPKLGLDTAVSKLGMIGAQLIVFSQLPALFNRRLRDLKNVYCLSTVHSTSTERSEVLPQSGDSDFRLSRLNERFILERPALDLLAGPTVLEKNQLGEFLLRYTEQSYHQKKSAEDGFWQALKHLSEQDKPTPIQSLGSQLSCIIPVVQERYGELERCLHSLRACDASVPIVISCAAHSVGVDSVASRYQALVIKAPVGGNTSRGALLNVALRSVSTPWVLCARENLYFAPHTLAVWQRYRTVLGDRHLYVLEATRMPPLPESAWQKSFSELSRTGRVWYDIEASATFASTDWITSVRGFEEQFETDFEHKEVCVRAESLGIRPVWLPRGLILRGFELEHTVQQGFDRDQKIVAEQSAYPRLLVNGADWGSCTVNSARRRCPCPAEMEPATILEGELKSERASSDERTFALLRWGAHIFNHGHVQSSSAAFEHALTLASENVDVHLGLAHCHLREGHMARAGHHLAVAARISPQHQGVTAMQNFIKELESR